MFLLFIYFSTSFFVVVSAMTQEKQLSACIIVAYAYCCRICVWMRLMQAHCVHVRVRCVYVCMRVIFYEMGTNLEKFIFRCCFNLERRVRLYRMRMYALFFVWPLASMYLYAFDIVCMWLILFQFSSYLHRLLHATHFNVIRKKKYNMNSQCGVLKWSCEINYFLFTIVWTFFRKESHNIHTHTHAHKCARSNTHLLKSKKGIRVFIIIYTNAHRHVVQTNTSTTHFHVVFNSRNKKVYSCS